MNLLVTEQVNQHQIAVTVVASEGSGKPVMNLYFLIIEERFKALQRGDKAY